MLSAGPLAGRVNHVMNGLFVTVLILYLAWGIVQLALEGTHARRSSVLRAVMLAPSVMLVLPFTYGPMISTLKADVIVACCFMLLSCLWIEFAEEQADTERFSQRAAALLVVSAFAIAVKLSAAVFCGVLMACVLGRLAAASRGGRLRVDRPIWAALVLSAVILGLVPLRGVVLSGYLAYPVTVLGANVDWKVPAAQAAAERAIIVSMSQLRPTYDQGKVQGWGWLAHWAQSTVLTDRFTLVLPLTLTLMCLAAAIVRGRRHDPSETNTPTWAYAPILAACAAALVVWWLEAPSSRFGFALFWVLAAYALMWTRERHAWESPAAVLVAGGVAGAVLVMLLSWVGVAPADRPGVIIFTLAAWGWMAAFGRIGQRPRASLAMLCVALALARPADRLVAHLIHGRLDDALAILWVTPDDYDDAWATQPIVARQTRSGLTVYQTATSRFDTPLPNTRYFNPYLELRRPGDLSSGFRSALPPDVAGYGYSIDPRRTQRPPDPSTAQHQ